MNCDKDHGPNKRSQGIINILNHTDCVPQTSMTNVSDSSQWIQAYPCKTNTSQETQRSLQKFQEPDRNPKVIYTDNSLEFGKACADLSWNHCTSTPHRSETNGIVERAVRRVKEGTSAVWNVSPICETSQICYLMGRRPVKDVLGNHLKDGYSIWFIG